MSFSNFLKIFHFFLFLNSCKAGWTGPSQRDEMMMTEAEATEFEKFKSEALPTAPSKWMKLDIGLMKYFAQAGKNAEAAKRLFKESLKLRLDQDNYKMSDELRDFGNAAVPMQEYTDKFGRFVGFFKSKRANFSEFFANDSMYQLGVHYLWSSLADSTERLAAKPDRKSFGYVTIVDVKDANTDVVFSDKGIATITQMLKEIDIRFPRFWQLYMIVNAPTAFEMPMTLVKAAMSEHTRNFFFVYSDDDKVWAPLIGQFMDIELLGDLYLKSKDVEVAAAPGAAVAPANPAIPPIPGAGMGVGRKIMGLGAPFGGVGAGVPPPSETGGQEKGNKKGKKKKKKSKKGEEDYDEQEE